jgi:ABC-type polysaccharide/polyol phosphate export permease
VQTLSHSQQLAINDIKDGLKNWRIWLLLAWQDIRMRYRRSTLGPLWITLSMAITIYSMGFLYGKLFKMDLHIYYPFLATGMLAWGLISAIITNSTNVFLESEQFIKQMKQPYFTFILRMVTREFIIFFHNILVLIPIILFFHIKINFYTLLIFFGLGIIWLNGVSYGLILALLGTRFRDIGQLVLSLIQVIFFVTPVMWSPTILPAQYHLIVALNPFAQFLALIRAPLYGTPATTYNYLTTAGITIFGFVFAFYLFTKFRGRIAYWL